MSTSKQLMLLIFVTLISPSLTNGFGLHLIKVPDEDRSQVMCTIALLSKYFRSGEPLSGSLLSMSMTSASVHIQQSLLDAIHSDKTYSWSVVVKDARHETPTTSSTLLLHEKPQCYFVVIENLEDEDLEDIFEDWRATINWNPLAQFVVYLASVEETDEEMTELMIEILLSFMNIKIYNVNVIGQNEENGFFYGKTVFPYHPDNNCGNRVIAIETLDICDYQGTEREDDEAELSYEYDEEEEQGADGNEEGGADNEEGDDNSEEDGSDNGEDGNDNEEAENNNEDGADEKIEGVDDNQDAGNDNEEAGDDKEENADENEDDENDNEVGVDKKKAGKDDNGEGANDKEDGNDNEEGAYEKIEGVDDNQKAGNDNEETEDDKEENAVDNEEDGNDNEEGADKKNEGEDDNGEGDDGKAGDGNDIEEGGDDNEDGAIDKTEVEDDNEEGADDKEEAGKDNEKGEDDNEESADENKDNADSNNEDVAEQEDNDSKEEVSNNAVEANNENDNSNGSAHDHKNPKNNADGLKSQENDSAGGEEPEHLIENNINQKDQPAKSVEETKTTSKGKVDDNDNKSEDYNSSNAKEDDETQIDNEYLEKNYDSNNKQSKKYKTMTKKKKYRYKNKRVKRQMAADEEEHNETEPSGKIYLEELYRALFLDKFPKDLSGCPLVAAYRPWEPYIFKEEYTTNDENYEDTEYTEVSSRDDEYGGSVADTEETVLGLKLSGIEYKMVQTIAERLHISIDIQVENKNLYHLFQQLIDGDIEMVVGGLDEDPSISQYVSSTIPYHQDDLTWCVAKAKRTYNMFNFLASFRMSIWALILTFVIITSLTIIFIQKTLKVKISYLQGYFTVTTRIYGVIFSQAIQLKRIPSALKICLGTAFFMSLMFSNVYHSFLISTLTTPKSSYQISHLDEIYSHRMSIMGGVENVRHLNKDGEIFKYIREKFQMCYNIEECLIRAANDDRIAVAVSRQHSFYNPRIPREQLYCFDRDENIYVYMVTLLLPKKFHLLHKINPIIQHVIESGHMQKWARDLDMKRKIKEEVHRVREDPVKKLTLSDVGGSIVFTAILLMFALLVFLVECWVHWMVTKRKTRLKLVKMLHKQFK